MRFLLFSTLALLLLSCTQADLVRMPSLLVPNADPETYYWVSGCVQQGGELAQQAVFNMSGGNYVNEIWYYNDSSCTRLSQVEHQGGSYALQSLGSTYNIDLRVTDWTLESRWDAYTDTINKENFCGFDDWKTGIPRSIFGTTCRGKTIPASSFFLYQIFNIATQNETTRSKGDLFFGGYDLSHDGSSPSARPIELNRDVRYRHYQ